MKASSSGGRRGFLALAMLMKLNRGGYLQMNRSIFVALLFCFLWSPASSQLSKEQLERSRDVSIFMSVGALEFVSGGIVIQTSDQYSLGLVTSAFMLRGRGFVFPRTARAFGVRCSYYFSRDGRDKFLWANAVIADVQYLLPTRNGGLVSMNNPGGVGVEAVVGRDGLVGQGIGVLWGVGIGASFYSEGPPLLSLAIRLGLHFDF